MWLKRALDFILYTHIFIGLCAMALCWGAFTLFNGQEVHSSYLIFAFCGTIWVYNLHRSVGLRLTKRENWPHRFQIFHELSRVNMIIGLITLVTGIYVFFSALLPYTLCLLPPVLVSLLYVFPLSAKKIVRSIPYLKIFLIAFVWAWITIVLPFVMSGQQNLGLVSLLFAERFLFILAITIPFDIRDRKQDTYQSVDTLVHRLGISGSKRLAYALLVICIIISSLAVVKFWMASLYAFLHWPVYIISIILVAGVRKKRKDSYYTLGLDGMMLLMGVLEVSYLWFL